MMLIDYDANGVHLLAMLGQKQLVRMSAGFLAVLLTITPQVHQRLHAATHFCNML